MKNKLIVIEGTDGSGKKTQTELLYKYLISVDNGVIGIPSLDIAKFYIENNNLNYLKDLHL